MFSDAKRLEVRMERLDRIFPSAAQAQETHPDHKHVTGAAIAKAYNDPDDESFKQDFEVSVARFEGSVVSDFEVIVVMCCQFSHLIWQIL